MRILYEEELRRIKIDIENHPKYILFTRNNKDAVQYMGEQELDLLSNFDDQYSLMSSINEMKKFQTYLEVNYQDLISKTHHFTEEELTLRDTELIENYKQENPSEPNEIFFKPHTGKINIPIWHFLKVFIDLRVSNMEHAYTMRMLLNFLKNDFRYSPQNHGNIERCLNAKIDFLEKNLPRNKYRPVLDKTEAIRLLNVSISTINQWIKKYPDFPYSKIGKKYGFDGEKLLNWYYGKKVS